MAWIESHQKLLTDPAMLMLAGSMKWDIDSCIGKLHRLWWWCVDHAEDGRLAQYNGLVLAGVMNCDTSQGEQLLDALMDSGFTEMVGGTLRVRNWWKFHGYRITKKYGRQPDRWREIKRLYCGDAASPETGALQVSCLPARGDTASPETGALHSLTKPTNKQDPTYIARAGKLLACRREESDQAEVIAGSYVRHDDPLGCRQAVTSALRGGVDPVVMLAGVLQCAAAACTAPGGSSNRFVPSARSFFGREVWREPAAFCQRWVGVEGKNEVGVVAEGSASLLPSAHSVPAVGRVPGDWREVWPLLFGTGGVPPVDFLSLPALTQRDLRLWCGRLEGEPADDRWRGEMARGLEAALEDTAGLAEAEWAAFPLEHRFRVWEFLEKKKRGGGHE